MLKIIEYKVDTAIRYTIGSIKVECIASLHKVSIPSYDIIGIEIDTAFFITVNKNHSFC